jgi:hypothetical protein
MRRRDFITRRGGGGRVAASSQRAADGSADWIFDKWCG